MNHHCSIIVKHLAGLVLLCFGISAFGAGDPVTGKTKAATCVACHGQDGNSQSEIYPSIAGQNANYLLTQLQAIQSGDRPAPLMTGQLDGLSAQDLLDLAAYYANQNMAVGGADATDADFLAMGEKIYRGGIASKGVAACLACHSPGGRGNSLAGFPKISGQFPSYIVQSLKEYSRKERGKTAHGLMMQQIAALLNDQEMQAVANYIYGLQ